MSMISTQCDELRKTADELQDVLDNGHNYTWSGFYSTLRYAQQELRSAADTIWELRCKLSGVVDQSEEIERLKVDNARLRQITKRMWPFAKVYLKLMTTLGLNNSESYDIEMVLRELGIEV